MISSNMGSSNIIIWYVEGLNIQGILDNLYVWRFSRERIMVVASTIFLYFSAAASVHCCPLFRSEVASSCAAHLFTSQYLDR